MMIGDAGMLNFIHIPTLCQVSYCS